MSHSHGRRASLVGSFRNGNADVRLCVSCANFGSCIVTSLKPCVPWESSTVIAEIKVVLEVRRCWKISQSETFPGEGIRSCMYVQQTIHGWAASLVRESACKLHVQRAKECNTVKVGCFLRRTARCVALRKLPSIGWQAPGKQSLKERERNTNPQFHRRMRRGGALFPPNFANVSN